MTKRLGNNISTRPPGSGKKKTDQRKLNMLLGRYLEISYKNIISVAMFGTLGWYLDKQFETKPYLLIFGIILGAAFGMYYMILLMSKFEKKSDE